MLIEGGAQQPVPRLTEGHLTTWSWDELELHFQRSGCWQSDGSGHGPCALRRLETPAGSASWFPLPVSPVCGTRAAQGNYTLGLHFKGHLCCEEGGCTAPGR